MLRITMIVVSSFMFSACAGSAYKLPPVTDAEVQAMHQKVGKNPAPLKVYERSDKHYERTLATITKRLTKSAKPLCDHSGYSQCHFQVKYSADDVFNAYASEGYKVTIHRGLLQYLKNNDEIAAVVAHEMGHHLANHNEEKAQNAAAGAAISGILTAVILGAAGANNAYYDPYQQQRNQDAIENMMHAGAAIGTLSYSKEQEREADLLATYLLSRAGYDLKRAQNIMVVLARFAGETDPSRSAFLDSHPAGMERVVAWEKAIEEIKANKSKLPYAIETTAPSQPAQKAK